MCLPLSSYFPTYSIYYNELSPTLLLSSFTIKLTLVSIGQESGQRMHSVLLQITDKSQILTEIIYIYKMVTFVDCQVVCQKADISHLLLFSHGLKGVTMSDPLAITDFFVNTQIPQCFGHMRLLTPGTGQSRTFFNRTAYLSFIRVSWQPQYFKNFYNMPLNVNYQPSHLLHNAQSQRAKPITSQLTRVSTLHPLQLNSPHRKTSNQNFKRSSSKNPLKSPRSNCVQTLQLRAMLKKAKEVTPSQTFLPPKALRPQSGLSHKLEGNLASRLRVILNGNTRLQGAKPQGMKHQQTRKEDETTKMDEEEHQIVEQPNDEMGSLSQIIFFGDGEGQELDIVQLKERISKGGEMECLQLLNYLEQC